MSKEIYKMKKNNPIILLVLSYFISAAAIIAIAFFIAPNNQDNSGFWYRVLWTEILNILFWFGSSGWFAIGKSEKTAITPSISLIVTLVCFLSFSLMLIEYKLTDIEILHRYHIPLQIGLFVLCALLILGTNLSSHYASVGMDIPDDAAKSPNDLSDFLLSLEKTLIDIGDDSKNSSLVVKIKTLREKIKYSFQDTAKTRTNSEYIIFCKSVFGFCASLESSLASKEELKIDSLVSELIRFINNVDRVSSSIRRA